MIINPNNNSKRHMIINSSSSTLRWSRVFRVLEGGDMFGRVLRVREIGSAHIVDTLSSPGTRSVAHVAHHDNSGRR